MDTELVERLYYGQDFMNNQLIIQIDKFREFIDNDKPIVTILCSDNRLQQQMDKLASYIDGVEVHICGTFNDVESILETILFSDALIVNTLALKIAPDGLYRALNAYKELNKDTYFILSGWESIPKTEELCKKKIMQIDNEFPFVRIKSIKNVFKKEIEGFALIEDVLSDYIIKIKESFTRSHNEQCDFLYNYVKSNVKEFRNEISNDIRKELSVILQLQNTFFVKKRRYELVSSHSSINVNDAFDRFEKKARNIDIDEIIYSLDSDETSSKEAFLLDPKLAEKKVKSKTADLLEQIIDEYLESNSLYSSVATEGSLQVTETENDLLSLYSIVDKMKFVYEDDKRKLEESIHDINDIDVAVNKYANSIPNILNQLRKNIRAKIMAYYYAPYKSNVVLSALNKLLSDSTDSNNNELSNEEPIKKDGSISEGISSAVSSGKQMVADNVGSQTEAQNNAKWDQFYAETQKMIEYAKSAIASQLHDYSRIANEGNSETNLNSIKIYFSTIIEQMEAISSHLKQRLNTFESGEI